MGTIEEAAHRVQVIVGADLDNLYYGDEPEEPSLPCKRVPYGDIYEASRAGDIERLKSLLKKGVNVNVRDSWDSVALYYACLAGHLDAARMLMEHGAICSENTFDGDRCHYASLNLKVRKLLKAFEARPPPLDPLPKSLRDVFLSSKSNFTFSKGISGSENSSILSDFPNSEHGSVTSDSENASVLSGFSSSMLINQHNNAPLSNASVVMGGTTEFKPDITFYVEGQPIEAHRAILIARSPYFKAKFQKDWKHKKEVRLSNNKLAFPALFSLVQFFYTDRLDVAVEDMEALSRICKVCGCVGLHKAVEKELAHQKFAEYKHMRNADDSQKRFILQGSSLPEHERLPDAMRNLLKLSLSKSKHEFHARDNHANLDKLQHFAAETSRVSEEGLEATIDVGSGCETSFDEDHADVCFSVEESIYRSHQVILAARSDYFRARFSRMECFGEENLGSTNITSSSALPLLREEDLSSETFEKLLEYMYTDEVLNLHPNQAEELFDAASRYLLFPLKRVVADALLPHLETATPDELCQWLLLAEMYGVWKLREYCLDTIAANFEVFSGTREFRKMLLSLPPPSGDSSQRTTVPSAPGEEGLSKQANVLDDLREKWLEAEGAELDERDQSAMQFDEMLELLIKTGESEAYENENESGLTSSTGQEDVNDLNIESLSM